MREVINMNPGELNHRITIQKDSGTVDSLNEHVASWTDYKTPWASFRTTGSRELYYAQKVYDEVTAVFIVRYRTDVDSEMRVKLGARIFEITGAPYDPDGSATLLMIPAKEVT